MLDVETIKECSLEEFIQHYETVKSLVDDQSQLLDLVVAVNRRLEEIPDAFSPKRLSLVKQGPGKKGNAKTLRLNDVQKVFHAYSTIKAMHKRNPSLKVKGAKFKFSDVFAWFGDFLDYRNDRDGENYKASKTSIAKGIAILVEKKLLERTVPTDKNGNPVYSQTEYSILPAFNKTSSMEKIVKAVSAEVAKNKDIYDELESDPSSVAEVAEGANA
jgi:hypothetical protein